MTTKTKKTLPARAALGKRAESLVAQALVSKGYQIVEQNARVGPLELDIIARRGSLFIFCEVRARSNDRWLSPAQSINSKKIGRLRRAAAQWLIRVNLNAVEVRFDAAGVVFDVPEGRIQYYEGAF